MEKIELTPKELGELVEAVGWIGPFYRSLVAGDTPQTHPDWGSVEYLAAEARAIELKYQAKLDDARGLSSWDCAHCDNAEIGGAFKECPSCGYAR